MIDKTVLFVDDSPTMRRIIMNLLNGIGFKEIIEAQNGTEALEKLNEKNVDLILTDWNMPEMSGEELVKKVRSDEQYKNVPILMITTRGMKEDVINAIKLGVNGYVVKPFTQEILKSKISEFLS